MGWILRGNASPVIAMDIWPLAPGVVSPVFHDDDGPHVAQVIERRPGPAIDPKSTRALIRSGLLQYRTAKRLGALQSQVRQRIHLVYDEAAIEWASRYFSATYEYGQGAHGGTELHVQRRDARLPVLRHRARAGALRSGHADPRTLPESLLPYLRDGAAHRQHAGAVPARDRPVPARTGDGGRGAGARTRQRCRRDPQPGHQAGAAAGRAPVPGFGGHPRLGPARRAQEVLRGAPHGLLHVPQGGVRHLRVPPRAEGGGGDARDAPARGRGCVAHPRGFALRIPERLDPDPPAERGDRIQEAAVRGAASGGQSPWRAPARTARGS